jgi:hypothetical protein
MGTYRFKVIPGELAIVRLAPHGAVPDWVAGAGPLVSLTRTGDELSIVCPAARVPTGLRVEAGWSALKLEGPIPFDQVGVLASIVKPLAEAGISVFAISTFDTDYVLIKTASLQGALAALTGAGHVRES